LRTIIINGLWQVRTVVAFAATLLLFSAAAAADRHDYTITVDADLERLTVVARFDVSTGNISARSRTAGQFLIEAHDCNSS